MGRLQNNPSIGWVHPKSTHARPLKEPNHVPEQNQFVFLTCVGLLGLTLTQPSTLMKHSGTPFVHSGLLALPTTKARILCLDSL